MRNTDSLVTPLYGPALEGYVLVHLGGKWGWCLLGESFSMNGSRPYDTLQEACDEIIKLELEKLTDQTKRKRP